MLGLSVIILFKSLLHVFCSLVFSAHNSSVSVLGGTSVLSRFFYYWGEPVPYLELFGRNQSKKHPVFQDQRKGTGQSKSFTFSGPFPSAIFYFLLRLGKQEDFLGAFSGRPSLNLVGVSATKSQVMSAERYTKCHQRRLAGFSS